MKKLIILLILTVSYHLGFTQDILKKPSTYALVHDYTGTLTADQRNQLEYKLRAFENSTSNQIAIVIIKSVGDYDINDYAQKLAKDWGIGTKSKNNGVILLVAIGDRKLAIQTGYGMEGALPDIYTQRIIQNDIKPQFKAGNYYAGIDAGTNSIISAVKGEYKNDSPKSKKNRSVGGRGSAAFLVIMIIIIIISLVRRGGGGGGGSQVIGGRGVADALLFGALLGGGRSSGGGWGGGSSGGGGFGGGSFGGGGFGGGGSSGSW